MYNPSIPSSIVPEGSSSVEWWNAAIRAGFRLARWHIRCLREATVAAKALANVPGQKRRKAMYAESIASHLKAFQFCRSYAKFQARGKAERFGGYSNE